MVNARLNELVFMTLVLNPVQRSVTNRGNFVNTKIDLCPKF